MLAHDGGSHPTVVFQAGDHRLNVHPGQVVEVSFRFCHRFFFIVEVFVCFFMFVVVETAIW